jgi:predicted DNA-binding transcriptional regulator YafY
MKLDIEIGIIITLLNKGKTTYKELSAKFDVSTRTICRYISILDTAGIPIVTKTGKNGGVEILNTFRLNNMFFTVQEKMTLITACSHINNIEMRKTIQDKLLLIK